MIFVVAESLDGVANQMARVLGNLLHFPFDHGYHQRRLYLAERNRDRFRFLRSRHL